jgi:hypothetical protein
MQLAQVQIAMRPHAKILIAAQAQDAVRHFKFGADLNDGRWPVWEIPEKILEPAHDVDVARTGGSDRIDWRHLQALEQTIDQLLLEPARCFRRGDHARLNPAHPGGIIV